MRNSELQGLRGPVSSKLGRCLGRKTVHRFARVAWLFAALVIAAPAFAQTFPTVPDNSVIGRLGAGSSSGPSSAIPFATLSAQLGFGNTMQVFNVAAYSSPAAAIAAASAAHSGIVWFPCGTYNLGSAAKGIDLDGKNVIRLEGPGGQNGGGAQCVTLTYSGTGSMISAVGSFGVEVRGLYLASSGAGSKIINLQDAVYSKVSDNTILFAVTSSSNIGIDLDNTQGAQVRGNTIGGNGGTCVRGIGASALWSVKATVDGNTFSSSCNIAIDAPGQAWTVSNNISQNPTTNFIRKGPVGRCDVLNVVSNDVDDVSGPKTLITSNCGTLISQSNRAATSGTYIVQDNSTGAVVSSGDRFGTGTGFAMGTGNFLSVTNPYPGYSAIYTGTPATSAQSFTNAGPSTFDGDITAGVDGVRGGRINLKTTTGSANNFLVGNTSATGTNTFTLPNAAGTLITQTDNVSVSNKAFGNSNIYTARDDRFTLQDSGDTTKQAAFELSGITTATTRTYTLPNASGTLIVNGAGTVTNSMLNADVFSNTHTWSAAQTFTANANYQFSATSPIYIAQYTNTHVTAGDKVFLVGGGVNGVDNTTSFFDFFDGSLTTAQGSIKRNGNGAVVYNTTSDQRVKTLVSAESRWGLDDLMKISVPDYTRRGSATIEQGYFAQQLFKIYPFAVSRPDPSGPDDPLKNPWGVDYGRITPLLVHSMQQLVERTTAQNRELRRRLDRLEKRARK
jgi:hypothetical protein